MEGGQTSSSGTNRSNMVESCTASGEVNMRSCSTFNHIDITGKVQKVVEAGETSGLGINRSNMVESWAASIEVNMGSISNHIDITGKVDQVKMFSIGCITTYSNEVNISVKVQKHFSFFVLI